MINENMGRDEFALVVANTFEEKFKDDSIKDKKKILALKIADLGLEAVLKQDEGFAKGVNIAKHYCTNKAVADSLNLEYK